MTYPEAVNYLLSLLGDVRTTNFGLARMRYLLDLLGNPQRAFRAVHIAGTNGKGSTAAYIEAGLRANGQRVGLYTSPHLVRINERVRVNGQEISDCDFAAVVDEVRVANERVLAARGSEDHPTFFESVTAMAFVAFHRAEVEWAVVEVGLGGRLDATNVLTGEVGVVTPIDFDHERFLGKDRTSISVEKAGIFKPGMRAVVAPQHTEVMAAIEKCATQINTTLMCIGKDWTAENVVHKRGCYQFRAQRVEILKLQDRGHRKSCQNIEVDLRMLGEHQIVNALTAVATLKLIGVGRDAVEKGLSETRWPGRLERIAGSPEILLDAAHNPAGARTLAKFLKQHEAGRRIHLIYGSVRDKAVDEVASVLFHQVDRVTLTCSQVSRSMRPRTLMKLLDHHHKRMSIAPNLVEALKKVRTEADGKDLIVVAGSIFLVGEVFEMEQVNFSAKTGIDEVEH